MRIIKINVQAPSPAVIQEAVRVLKRGGVIVYPTETCYGLGAAINQPTAIKKIFLIKGREKKPLPLVAGNMAQVKKIAELNSSELKLAKKYWPGPLTILLKTKGKLLKGLQRNGRVAVRIPGLALVRNLCLKLGGPLTATSANLAGQPSSYKIKDAIKQFKNRTFKPDLFLDAGQLPKIKPSTIAVFKANKIKILRKGPIKINV